MKRMLTAVVLVLAVMLAGGMAFAGSGGKKMCVGGGGPRNAAKQSLCLGPIPCLDSCPSRALGLKP